MPPATVTTAMDYAIEMDGITRRFGDFVAVDHVTLKIPKGTGTLLVSTHRVMSSQFEQKI